MMQDELRNPSSSTPLVRSPIFLTVDRLARFSIVLAVPALLLAGGIRLGSIASPGQAPATVEVEEGDLRYVFPEAESFSALSASDGIGFYNAYGRVTGPGSEGVSRIGVCFLTTGVDGGAVGWGGPVQVLVGLSVDGEIKGVKLMPGRNNESKGFVERLYDQEFDSMYRGKDFRDPFEAGADIDGVTGATVSVEAVNASVRNSARLVGQRVLGLDPGSGRESGVPPAASFLGPAVAVLLLLAGLIAALSKAGRVYRTALLVIAAATAIALNFSYVTTADALRALSLDPLPGRSFFPWAVVVAAWLAATLVLGKAWCAWVCPFGALQELAFRALPRRLSISEPVDRRLRLLRWPTFLGLAAILVAAPKAGGLVFEPLASAFHPRALTAASAALLLAIAASSTVIERFWCKYFCPVGALVGLAAQNRLLWRRAGEQCGGCLRFEKGCRYARENGPEYARRGPGMHGDCVC